MILLVWPPPASAAEQTDASIAVGFAVLRNAPADAGIDDVCCSDTYRFGSERVDHVTTRYGQSPLWLRVTDDLPPGILQLTPVLDRATLYARSPQGTGWEEFDAGDSIPAGQRALNTPAMAIPVPETLAGGEIYIRIEQLAMVTVELDHWNPEVFASRMSADLVWKTLTFGFVFAVVLYNILISTLIRDVAYLLNAMCITSLMVQASYLSGYGAVYVWPDSAHLSNVISYLSILMAVMSGALFMWTFVKTPVEHFRQGWPLLASSAFAALVLISAPVLPPWQVQLAALICAATFLITSMVFVGFRAFRGDARARILLFPMAFAILPGIAATAAEKIAGLKFDLFAGNVLELTLCLEALLFSLALAARIRTTEMEKAKANAQLMALRNASASKAIEAQDAERKRLAQELHDGVGQDFLFVLGDLKRIEKEAPFDWRASIGKLIGSATAAVEELRRISRDMYPSTINYLGLEKALVNLAEGFADAGPASLDYEFAFDESRFTPSEKLHIYRIMQECLSNILRHAKADHVRLRISQTGETTSILVEDDGTALREKGLDALKSNGVGLNSIDERVRSMGGTWQMSMADIGGLRTSIQF